MGGYVFWDSDRLNGLGPYGGMSPPLATATIFRLTPRLQRSDEVYSDVFEIWDWR